jgi:hypothetical protein
VDVRVRDDAAYRGIVQRLACVVTRGATATIYVCQLQPTF